MEHIVTIVGYLLGGGSTIALIFQIRKNRAQADTISIGNMSEIIENYKKALEDLEQRYEKKYMQIIEDARAEIELIEKSNERKCRILEDEIKAHKRRNNLVKQENMELRKQLRDAVGDGAK